MIDTEMEESQSGKFKRATLLRSAYHYGGKFTLGSKASCDDAGAGIVSPKLYRHGERASPIRSVEPPEFSHGINGRLVLMTGVQPSVQRRQCVSLSVAGR